MQRYLEVIEYTGILLKDSLDSKTLSGVQPAFLKLDYTGIEPGPMIKLNLRIEAVPVVWLEYLPRPLGKTSLERHRNGPSR